MSQFWAMLRDSFREAIDGWVFLTMFVLSGLVLVVVASASVAPAPADQALPPMLVSTADAGGPVQGVIVAADRGRSPKKAKFLFRFAPSAVRAESAARPWTAPVTFDLSFKSTGGGAAGIESDLDEKGQPKLDDLAKRGKDAIVFGDPFREAVRYWASPDGRDKPDYSDELAREYLTQEIRARSGLEVTGVTVKAAAKPAGGLLGGLLGGGAAPPQFAVTASHGTRVGWGFEPSLFFGAWDIGAALPLAWMVYFVESFLVNGIGVWVILLTGVVITAGFVPNMLRKGQIDLLLSKPIARPLILLYKYVGGLVFVFLLTAFTLGGVWLVVGLRTGVWSPGLLWCVPVVTGYFAILYAVSTLLGVLTRNGLVAILGTILFWFAVFLVGFAHAQVTDWVKVSSIELPPPKPGESRPPNPFREPPPNWLVTTTDVLNKITPRTNDLDELSTQLIRGDIRSEADQRESAATRKGANWAGAIGVSAAWVAGLLGLAMLRFVTRSY